MQEEKQEKNLIAPANNKKSLAVSKRKKNLEKVFLKDKKSKEDNLRNEEKLKSLKDSPEIQRVFSAMQKSIEIVFNHYCKSTSTKDGISGDLLILVGFNKFCLQFNISPGLISTDECLKVFRAITKSRPTDTGAAISLGLEEFKESILRLSQISKSDLEKDLSLTFSTEDQALKGFFEYLNITPDIKQTRNLLQNININNNKVHPRDKVRMKNQLNKSLSRDITPAAPGLRSKSTSKPLVTGIVGGKNKENS